MCGINGYLQARHHYDEKQLCELLMTMNKQIVHRGPDDSGIFVNKNAGISMQRLSIIDISTGHQPIYNRDKTLVIVFNGELYNYLEIKKELIQKGHSFVTTSDTEVVLHCYEEYGIQSLAKFKGMFAFAIYNICTQTLILARDRAGEKPLYYHKGNGFFIFASELKSLSASGLTPKDICKKALCQYLQLTYIPAPLTIYEEVYKLPPGHYIEVSSNSDISITKYWDLQYKDSKLIEDYEVCKNKLRKALIHAVEQCMVSDVPIGSFLSGGIDSTIITGIMSKISTKRIDTFTIGFHNKSYDESQRAALVSQMHNTNHYAIYLDYNDMLPELERILANIDEPFADSSYLPSYMVSKHAVKHVKTVLTGDAGDELFGGYSKYLIGYYTAKYNSMPSWFRSSGKHMLKHIKDTTALTRKLNKVIENAENPIFEQRRNLMCLGFKPNELTSLLKHDFADKDSLRFIYNYYTAQKENSSELSSALYTDFKVVLEGDMLAKVDRASMLCSLETRTPFLYVDMIELATCIPSQYKINARQTKVILKDTFQDFIPKQLLNAAKKGFSIPMAEWLRNDLKTELVEILNREHIEDQGIFNYSYISHIMQEHFSGARNRASELWALLVFQRACV